MWTRGPAKFSALEPNFCSPKFQSTAPWSMMTALGSWQLSPQQEPCSAGHVSRSCSCLCKKGQEGVSRLYLQNYLQASKSSYPTGSDCLWKSTSCKGYGTSVKTEYTRELIGRLHNFPEGSLLCQKCGNAATCWLHGNVQQGWNQGQMA